MPHACESVRGAIEENSSRTRRLVVITGYIYIQALVRSVFSFVFLLLYACIHIYTLLLLILSVVRKIELCITVSAQCTHFVGNRLIFVCFLFSFSA